MKWTDESDREPERPDLDVWRAEAGEATTLADAAPIGPWEFGEREGGFAGRWVTTQDPCHCIIQLPIGAGPFIAAARTGWPRDAARVAALVDRCEVLQAALSEALDEFEDAIQYKLEYLVTKHGDRKTLARLRALAAGEEPAR